MMASSVKEPFDNPNWIFETKLDGYRAIAVIDSSGKARLWPSKRLPPEPKFPRILEAVNELSSGPPPWMARSLHWMTGAFSRFRLLRKWQKCPAPVCFYLFDLLWCDARDITARTVLQ
jgi:bifunctional non-homologous end joining protein LigD